MENGSNYIPINPREIRCDCGSLVARICDGGVELKCRRCKRIHIIPLLGRAD